MPTNHGFSANETSTALELLSGARIAREAELDKVSPEADKDESEEGIASECPIYDSFFVMAVPEPSPK